MQPSVAIILINWNSLEVTSDCIVSLKGIQYANYSIVVVDNGSADGSGKALKQLHPEIILIESATNLGFAGGNNLGFDYALAQAYDYTIMLNNDTLVEPDFLSHLVQYMEAHPQVGAIQPRIHFNHNRDLLWNGGSYYAKCWGYFYSKDENKIPSPESLTIKEVDWITGCAFLTKTKTLQQTGLLAEQFFMYSEDVDLSFRIKALGLSLVYHGDSVIYHIAGQSNKSKTKGKEGFVNPNVHYMNQRNRIWVLKKYTPWYCIPTVLTYNLIYLLGVLAYFLVRRRFSKFKIVLKAIKDGLLGNIH
ncbi:glycosyltransferase family 2 protein [Sediminibacterium sp. TEGAF015]|uniref:glycosyltransferase family 2 protein n=1 Tax=Sediminibacterium sp. TEGAF015 TaxID=575378 RepID=UPI0022087BDA|nr:glycosyltransferase family 2 protein [Sediminibacterium sp. TEGAF015]BDQ13376.1 glycosyl transferase [Sediminibacterium sp. TEGAF015]